MSNRARLYSEKVWLNIKFPLWLIHTDTTSRGPSTHTHRSRNINCFSGAHPRSMNSIIISSSNHSHFSIKTATVTAVIAYIQIIEITMVISIGHVMTGVMSSYLPYHYRIFIRKAWATWFVVSNQISSTRRKFKPGEYHVKFVPLWILPWNYSCSTGIATDGVRCRRNSYSAHRQTVSG